jgi:nitrate/nitrite transporter NarK
VGLFVLRTDRKAAPVERFDFVGAVSFMLMLFTVVLALSRGAAWGWTSGAVLIAGVIGTAIAILFLWNELHSPHPFFDIHLFRHRLPAAATVSAMPNYMATTTTAFLTPFFLIQGNQMAPGHAGSLLMAMPLVMAMVAPVSGWLSDRIGSRVPTAAGMACLAAGMFLLGRLGAGGSDRQIVLRLGLVGLGIGLFTSPNNLRTGNPGGDRGLPARRDHRRGDRTGRCLHQPGPRGVFDFKLKTDNRQPAS